VATDLAWLFRQIVATVERAGFVPIDGAPVPERPVSKFERKYAPAGAHAATFRYAAAAAPDAQAP
jgi:hypothetical protein